jgi:hypothetical protein
MLKFPLWRKCRKRSGKGKECERHGRAGQGKEKSNTWQDAALSGCWIGNRPLAAEKTNLSAALAAYAAAASPM